MISTIIAGAAVIAAVSAAAFIVIRDRRDGKCCGCGGCSVRGRTPQDKNCGCTEGDGCTCGGECRCVSEHRTVTNDTEQ